MASVVFDGASRIYPGTTAPAVDKLNLTVNDGVPDGPWMKVMAGWPTVEDYA